MSSSIDPSHDQISERARSLWESRGRPEGNDADIWLEAERELKTRAVTASASTPTTISSAAAGKEQPGAHDEKVRRNQRKDIEAKNRAPAPEARNPLTAPRSNGPRA